jgi:hypothetical protein
MGKSGSRKKHPDHIPEGLVTNFWGIKIINLCSFSVANPDPVPFIDPWIRDSRWKNPDP